VKPENKKEVLAEFKQLLKQHLPEYTFVKAGLPLRSAFKKEVNHDLQLYLLIHWHSYDEKFNLEVGWTYKATLDDIGSQFNPASAMKADAVIIGLSAITGQKETWWDVRTSLPDSIQDPTNLKREYGKPVELAFNLLLRLGIPYLEQVTTTKLANG
jgi:hypothetical protein